MNTKHATLVKQFPQLPQHLDARLYRLSSPVAIYDDAGAATEYVIVSKVSVLTEPGICASMFGPALGAVAVFPADQYGDQYDVPHLTVLVGTKHTHADALKAIGFPTIVAAVESWDTAATGGSARLTAELRDGIFHVTSFDYTPAATGSSTAEEILGETYAPAAEQKTTLPLPLDELKDALAVVLLYIWGPECFEEARFYPGGRAKVRGGSALSLDRIALVERMNRTSALRESLSDALIKALTDGENPLGWPVEFVSLFPCGSTRIRFKFA